MFYVQYDNVEGLSPDARVTVNGLHVGKVKQIMLSENSTKMTVSFFIDKSGFNFSKTSKVRLYSPDLIGGKSLAIISDYTNSTIAVQGDTLKGEMERSMMDIIAAKVLPLGDDLGLVLSGIDTLVGKLNLVLDDKGINHLKNSIAQIEQTSNSLNLAMGSITKLLDDNYGKMNSSFTNIEKASKNFAVLSESLATFDAENLVAEIETAIASLKNLTVNLDKGEGSLGKLLKDDSLYLNLEGASKELEELLKDVKLNPKRYVHFSVFGKKNKEFTQEDY